VLQLASEGIDVPAEHELLAPTLLRSQTLSALHEAVHRGEMPPDVALERLTRIWAMPIRLLGDAVLRRNACSERRAGECWPSGFCALPERAQRTGEPLGLDPVRWIEVVPLPEHLQREVVE
jgi:hypothetical protein